MSLKQEFLALLNECPIIASLLYNGSWERLLKSRARVALISSGSIFTVAEECRLLREKGKMVLVHADLISGLGRDHDAVRYLKEKAGVQGIVTPSTYLITLAKKEKLLTVHRFFAHDSPSLKTGVKVLKQAKPDLIEVLPGVAFIKVAGYLRQQFSQPLVAGGFVKEENEVREILQAGAAAVDTSEVNLWNFALTEQEKTNEKRIKN